MKFVDMNMTLKSSLLYVLFKVAPITIDFSEAK